MNGNDNEPLCFLYQYVIQSDLEVVGGYGLWKKNLLILNIARNSKPRVRNRPQHLEF